MNKKKLNKKIDKRIEELHLYNIVNHYRVGCDTESDGSQQAYALWGKNKIGSCFLGDIYPQN